MNEKITEFLKVLDGRAHEWGVMPTKELRFLTEVADACKRNLCGKYNTCHTCPPACGTLEENKERITAFSSAFIFTTKYDLEDSFDYEGMTEGSLRHDELTRAVHKAVGKTNPVYGAGGCRLCPKCTYPEPCRRPEDIFTSIEACGINVTDLSKSANVKYNNGAATVTYFSMVLFD